MTMWTYIVNDARDARDALRCLARTLCAAVLGRRNDADHTVTWHGMQYDVAPPEVQRQRAEAARRAWARWKGERQP